MRLLVVLVVVLVSLGLAAVARGRRRPDHPPVSIDAVDAAPGVVAFTSSTCSTCADALARVAEFHVPVREVSHQVEPSLFAAAGVDSVPLIVVTDRGGTPVAQFVGVPPRRALARAIRSAGWAGA